MSSMKVMKFKKLKRRNFPGKRRTFPGERRNFQVIYFRALKQFLNPRLLFPTRMVICWPFKGMKPFAGQTIGSLSIKGLSMFESFTVSIDQWQASPRVSFPVKSWWLGLAFFVSRINETGLAPVELSDKELQAQVHELQVFRGVWVWRLTLVVMKNRWQKMGDVGQCDISVISPYNTSMVCDT